uniref:Uncharacterized protein n=1 Tax=Strongyloides venezuelensis TaxID=75913 RepID=A0A0K0FFK6_STRVS
MNEIDGNSKVTLPSNYMEHQIKNKPLINIIEFLNHNENFKKIINKLKEMPASQNLTKKSDSTSRNFLKVSRYIFFVTTHTRYWKNVAYKDCFGSNSNLPSV